MFRIRPLTRDTTCIREQDLAIPGSGNIRSAAGGHEREHS